MSHAHFRVVAIFPSTRGFGFAVFEGPTRLIDWGLKEAREDKNVRSLAKMVELLDSYTPDVLVVEDYAGEGSRRSLRIQQLIKGVIRLATKKKVSVQSYSRAEIRAFFSQFGATNKDQVARVIVSRLPELKPRLPKERKIWMSEDSRMSIFDAVALALTFFHVQSGK